MMDISQRRPCHLKTTTRASWRHSWECLA